MSYIGNGPPLLAQYGVESFNGGGTSFTLSKPATTATVLVFIDGVRQTPTDAYSVSGVTLTTTATTPSGTDNVTVQFLGDVVDFGEPSDDSVSTAKIQDDAVTAAKLANSINTEIAANTAKVTNATHTGDVTGATALTIAADAVDIAMLSATGTASSTTFLRGDNAWASAAAGLNSVQTFTSSGTWTRPSDITKVIMEVQGAGGSGSATATGSHVGGGGGGGYSKKLLDVSSISSSTITVGTAGAAVSVTNSGSDGTNTVTANGGAGAQRVTYDDAQGGTASGGDINMTGGIGHAGGGSGAFGGMSVLGFSGMGGYTGESNRILVGNGYGAGGGGVYNASSGAGTNGIVVVWEYK